MISLRLGIISRMRSLPLPQFTNATINSRAPEPCVSGQPMKHVAFGVLGLGNTNYDRFCETAKVVDKKLEDCGGVRVKNLGMADEGTGMMEDVVEGWVEDIVPLLAKACGPPPVVNLTILDAYKYLFTLYMHQNFLRTTPPSILSQYLTLGIYIYCYFLNAVILKQCRRFYFQGFETIIKP